MKKGFTLIELLAVIIVIAIISLIIFPVVTRQIGTSKEDLYNIQVDNIKKAAKDMVLDNSSLLDETHMTPTLISIEELQTATNSKGVTYLEEGTIKNPKDQSEMTGTVIITYDEASSGYVYEYQEKSKAELERLIASPAARTIINKQPAIYTNEQETGLFEDVSRNLYIFKGANPANFIRINNSLWRIININKDTYAMKIAKTTHNVKSLWANSSSETNTLFSNTNLKIYTYLNSDFYNTLSDEAKALVVENSEWNIGSVSGNLKEVSQILQNEEKKKTFHANVGLLSVSDLVSATYDLKCRKDYSLPECANTNYLIMDKEYFLINPVASASTIWAVSNVSKGIKQTSLAEQMNVIPTMYLSSDAKIEAGGAGTADNPYILKLD